jgi:TolA-binding protein
VPKRPPARLVHSAVALALAAAASPVLAAGPAAERDPPVHVSVDMEGTGWTGENCEGGEWNFAWSGPVAVEAGPLADLLISYTAFDTTQPNQRAIPPAKLDVKPVKCRDNDGNVVLRGTVTPSGGNNVQMSVALADDSGAGTPAIAFTGDDLGVCHVQSQMMNMDYPVMVGVNTRGLNTLSPALALTLDDLKNGFDKTYRFDGTVIGAPPMCMGAELKSGTLRMRYKAGEDDPTVSFDACLHLAKNEVREVTATGSPAGGAYRFSTYGSTFAVTGGGGNSASVRGQTPGKGDVTVQYERSGRVASATVAGSVVDVISINGGTAIPKLGLYGADGLLIKGTHDFPLKLDPVDGYVQMKVKDEALASVVNTTTRVQIQPTKMGRTTMQAQTLCGTPLGPVVDIEIVRCSDEVQKKLKDQQQQLKSQIDQLVKRITQLTGSDEFQEASKEIAQATKDIAIKTGETIIGTLSFGKTKQIEFAEKAGITLSKSITLDAKRIDVVSTVWDIGDMLNDAGEATDSPTDWQKVAKPLVSLAVQLSGNEAIALGKTYGEAYLAAEKFGKYLGTLAGVAEQLENLEPQLDRAVKEYVRISTRLEYCEKASRTDQPAPQPPKPGEPKPAPIPVEQEVPTEIPVPEEPVPPKTEEPVPPPTQEPGQKIYGLACRIQDLRAPGVEQRLQALRRYVLATQAPPPATPSQPTALESFTDVTVSTALARAAELQTLQGYTQDLKTLKQIGDAQAQQLKQAQTELQTWQSSLDRMNAAIAAGDEQARAAFAEFRQARDRFVLGAASHGTASLETMMETDECRDRLEVKVDQVRARYN